QAQGQAAGADPVVQALIEHAVEQTIELVGQQQGDSETKRHAARPLAGHTLLLKIAPAEQGGAERGEQNGETPVDQPRRQVFQQEVAILRVLQQRQQVAQQQTQ